MVYASVSGFRQTGPSSQRPAYDLVAEAQAQGADKAVELISGVEQESAMLASEDNDFLIRMGVSRKLLTEIMYKQKAVAAGGDKSTRRCLTQSEAVKYNVANAQ